MIRECKKHGLTEYRQYKNGKKSNPVYRCLKCNVEAVKKRRNNLKEKAVAYKGGKCQNPDCGYMKYIGALEFHHPDKNKEFGIASKGYTRSWEIVKRELDKCIMLCSNCHKEAEAGLLDVSKINNKTHVNILKNLNYCIDCGTEIKFGLIRCKICHIASKRKVVRPSLEQLKEEINKIGYCATGRKYNVSSTSIRKWVIFYEKHNILTTLN